MFSVASGRRVHTRSVPRASRSLDLQGGVATFANGRQVVGLDTVNGRSAVVARSSAPLTSVQIEAPGLVYASTSGSRGVARLVITRTIDLALGRLAARDANRLRVRSFTA